MKKLNWKSRTFNVSIKSISPRKNGPHKFAKYRYYKIKFKLYITYKW